MYFVNFYKILQKVIKLYQILWNAWLGFLFLLLSRYFFFELKREISVVIIYLLSLAKHPPLQLEVLAWSMLPILKVEGKSFDRLTSHKLQIRRR